MTRARWRRPDFASPPVVEVALSVQFERIEGLRTPQMARLWTRFRSRYPQLEEQPALEPVIEEFGVLRPTAPEFQIRLVGASEVPRFWFLSEDGTELVQVQQDRFVVNWRRTGSSTPYPRYRQIRRRLQRELKVFEAFIEREGLGSLVPNQGEVTYIDEILPGPAWERHGQIAEVVTVWQSSDGGFLSEPERVAFSMQYAIQSHRNAEPHGRLHIDLKSLYRRAEGTPIFLLTMTARGKPDGQGVPGVLKFMDLGQEWIVRGFEALTTDKMHDAWGRRDGN